MATAVDVGKDQLSLQVTDTDPQRAALLANTWAEKVTDMVNTTYELGASRRFWIPRFCSPSKDYEQAQAALEEALSKSQVDALNAQLDSRKADLTVCWVVSFAPGRHWMICNFLNRD